MIEDFSHKALQQLFEQDISKGINAAHVKKLKQMLALLAAAQKINDLDYNSYRLHPLEGKLKGFWSMTVNKNWRLIFRFENGNASDVDLVDYH